LPLACFYANTTIKLLIATVVPKLTTLGEIPFSDKHTVHSRMQDSK
jgi:hypothetical protein